MKNKKSLFKIIIASVLLAPASIALAASPVTATGGTCTISGLSNFKDIIIKFVVGCLLYRSVFLMMGIAMLFFIWGVFKFMRSEGDDKQSGRDFIVWGLVGLFVMVSIWGLVYILQSTFHLGDNLDITPRPVNLNF